MVFRGGVASSAFNRTYVTIEHAGDQLMAFLGYIKPSMQPYSTFCNHKSAVAKGFRVAFGFELGTDVFISQWMKGWKIELPPKPRHDPDEEGWDVGLIVEYWSTQLDNNELSTVELDTRLYLFSPFRYTPESPTSLDWPVTSWTYHWLILCDSAILVLRSFGLYRSSLGKLVYPGGHIFGYVRSWLSRPMWIVHLLLNMFTPTRYTLFSMFSCLKYPTELLVFTSRWALRLVPDGFVPL